MTNIPTAKEFWDSKCKTDELKSPGDIMIEFAKLHVEAALKEASEKVKMKDINEDCHFEDEDGNYPEIMVFDRDAILNAYPLNNIK